jgi:hypothetical protein
MALFKSTVMKSFLTLFLFCSIGLTLSAQQDTVSKKAGSTFKLGIHYTSYLHYYGRRDSVPARAILPVLEWWMGQKVYISVAPVFVKSGLDPYAYAGTVATAGYLHMSKKWMTSLYLSKPFYTPSAQLVQSAIEAQGGGSLSFQNPVVNVTAGGDVKWSNRFDGGASAGIDHAFKKRLRDSQTVIVVNPSLFAYGGTRHFTRTEYQQQPAVLLFPGTTQKQTRSESRFAILAYELSIPLILAHGNWMLMVTPTYVMPRHMQRNDEGPEEYGDNHVYVTAGLKYRLSP